MKTYKISFSRYRQKEKTQSQTSCTAFWDTTRGARHDWPRRAAVLPLWPNIFRRNDPLRQRPLSHRVVPLFLCLTYNKTQRQMVLSQMPWWPTERHETERTILKRTRTVQQGERRKSIVCVYYKTGNKVHVDLKLVNTFTYRQWCLYYKRIPTDLEIVFIIIQQILSQIFSFQ